jgi:hypothetical protein
MLLSSSSMGATVDQHAFSGYPRSGRHRRNRASRFVFRMENHQMMYQLREANFHGPGPYTLRINENSVAVIEVAEDATFEFNESNFPMGAFARLLTR